MRLQLLEVSPTHRLTADQYSRTPRWQHFANWRWNRSHAACVSGHVIHSSCRQSTDKYRCRSFGDHSGASGNAARQHAGQSCIRHTSCRHASDQDGWLPFNNRQWQRGVRNGRWSGSRRVNRRVTMRCILFDHVGHSGRWLSHGIPLFTDVRLTRAWPCN